MVKENASSTGHPPLHGRMLFSFAVITDVHVNPEEDECNSPFPVNRLANRRFRHVVRKLNTLDIDFVLNLGDLVHPVPAVPDLYDAACARYTEIARELRHPMHTLPGNHDVGDKPLAWSPAEPVSDDGLAIWEKHFGRHYRAFDNGGCRFILLNAQLLNSGLGAEQDQRKWLEEELAGNSGKKLFFGIHYPLFLDAPDEPEHYDNIAEPARAWLLGLLEQHKVEAVFSGHVHNFWYTRFADTDLYTLPATSFVRQDYSEMFEISPAADMEAGRNDTGKLGFAVVNVFENGHTLQILRTAGLQDGPDDIATRPALPVPRTPHPGESTTPALGFSMRQPWLEQVDIPPSGGLDEFDRKQVRNDYPLMTLWEIGAKNLRIPLRDLTDDRARARLCALRRQGHEFTLFNFGKPEERLTALLAANKGLISNLEIVLRPIDISDAVDAIGTLKNKTSVHVFLSLLHQSDHASHANQPYYHVIRHRCDVEDAAGVARLMAIPELPSTLDGLVFHVRPDQNPVDAALSASRLCMRHNLAATLHLSLATANPAAVRQDDHWVANRICEAVLAAHLPDVTVFCETFADVDRGYFVHNGIVDRRYNPRAAFHAIRSLQSELNEPGVALKIIGSEDGETARTVSFECDRTAHTLMLPKSELPFSPLPCTDALTSGDPYSVLELTTGKRFVSEGPSGRSECQMMSAGSVLISHSRSKK